MKRRVLEISFILVVILLQDGAFAQKRILDLLDSLENVPFKEKDLKKANQVTIPEMALEPGYIRARIERMDKMSPIPFTYNEEVHDFIDLYLRRRTRNTVQVLGLAPLYYPLFESQLDRHGLPLEIKNLAIVESGLNPTARSHVGATGLWQFMYTTGEEYGLKINNLMDERMDPFSSTIAACEYLKRHYRIYGDWLLAIASYNCGAGNVNKAIRRSGGETDFWKIKKHLPNETSDYVPAFIAASYIYNYAEEMELFGITPDIRFRQLDTVHVRERMRFQEIHELTGYPVDKIRFLNPSFPEGIIPEGYVLSLPRNVIGNFVEKEYLAYDEKKPETINRMVEGPSKTRKEPKDGTTNKGRKRPKEQIQLEKEPIMVEVLKETRLESGERIKLRALESKGPVQKGSYLYGKARVKKGWTTATIIIRSALTQQGRKRVHLVSILTEDEGTDPRKGKIDLYDGQEIIVRKVKK